MYPMIPKDKGARTIWLEKEKKVWVWHIKIKTVTC